MAANCALAAAQPQAAQDWAQAAYRLFRSQRSTWWQAHAARVLVQARYEVGPVSPALLRQANRAAAGWMPSAPATRRKRICWPDALALKLGRRDDTERHLGAVARTRGRGPALSRSAAGSARRYAPRPSTVRAGC